MKTNGTLESAKLKAEPIKVEGVTIDYEKFWLISVKVPADHFDANELHRMVGQTLDVSILSQQIALKLDSVDRETGELKAVGQS